MLDWRFFFVCVGFLDECSSMGRIVVGSPDGDRARRWGHGRGRRGTADAFVAVQWRRRLRWDGHVNIADDEEANGRRRRRRRRSTGAVVMPRVKTEQRGVVPILDTTRRRRDRPAGAFVGWQRGVARNGRLVERRGE